jgi:hypothetical protein
LPVDVALITTLPVDWLIVIPVPAVIDVTIPVRKDPDPEKFDAVTIPETFASPIIDSADVAL